MIGYNTELDLTGYAAERDITLTGNAAALLTKALDWLELQPFSGSRTDDEQEFEFPRNGEEEVPQRIKTAQLVAAILIDSGEDLLQPQGQRVLSESAGAVSVSYSDTSRQATMYPQLLGLLRPYLGVGSGNVFRVARG